MNEYLKMTDVFDDSLSEYDMDMDSDKHIEYALHAIKNHDALVSDVERLRVLLGDCKDLIESLGFKHGFGSNDINNVLNSIGLELSKK